MAEYVQLPDGRKVELPADPAKRAQLREAIRTRYSSAETASRPAPQEPRTSREVTVPQEESGLVNFGRGLTRIPQLFEGGERGAAARERFVGGAGQALEATGRGIMKPFGNLDDAVIAGISEGADVVTGNETGTFGEKFERSRERGQMLEEENPLSSFVGQLYGFGRTGQALRGGVKKATGKNLGVGGEAAILAGASTLAEGEDLGDATVNAALGFVGGKAAEGIADAIVAPAAKFVAGRLDPRQRSGELSAAVVNGIANRTGRPAAEIRAAVDEFRAANGYTPSMAEIADPETITKFAQLARNRQEAAGVFREAEEAAAVARPERMATAVERTGATRRGVDEIAEVEAAADVATNAAREARDAGVAEAVDEATFARRMVREETDKLIAAQKGLADEAGEELRRSLSRATELPDDMATSDAIDASIKTWADDVMQAPRRGLDKRKIDIDPETIERKIPRPAIQRVLKGMLDNTPSRTTKFKRLTKAMENLDAGKPVRLTIREMDSMRRALGSMTDDAGVRYDLNEAIDALVDTARKQVPEYATFLDKYAQLQRVSEGFKRGRGVLTEGPNTMRVDVEAMDKWGRAGAGRGAMARINDTLGAGAEPMNVAAQLVQRRTVLERALGAKGKELADMSERALERVSAITDEIAEIQEAARNTRDGLSDAAKRRVRELRATAKKEVAKITSDFTKNREALRAADDVLTRGTNQFEAAVSDAADPNLPLGDVARASVADAARQSPAQALRTAQSLTDTATRRRLGGVMDEASADALGAIGAGQTRAAQNLNVASVRGPNDGVVSEEVSAALDIAATLTGRAGAGFAANAIRRELVRLSRVSLNDRQVTALARAVTSNDPRLVDDLLNRLATTQETRRLIEDAIERAVVAASANAPSTRMDPEEGQEMTTTALDARR